MDLIASAAGAAVLSNEEDNEWIDRVSVQLDMCISDREPGRRNELRVDAISSAPTLADRTLELGLRRAR